MATFSITIVRICPLCRYYNRWQLLVTAVCECFHLLGEIFGALSKLNPQAVQVHGHALISFHLFVSLDYQQCSLNQVQQDFQWLQTKSQLRLAEISWSFKVPKFPPPPSWSLPQFPATQRLQVATITGKQRLDCLEFAYIKEYTIFLNFSLLKIP